MESHRFEADVRQILHLVTHSLYSDREIFLRELISNASDALDRARFEGLSRADLRPAAGDPGVKITVDKDQKTITISDDGVGLTHDQAVEHLGTIARSGTKAFANMLKERGENAEGLIGQFGVGFYSAFMVAEKVEVRSLSALPDAAPIHWVSDGGEAYDLTTGDRADRGTDVILHLRDEAIEFCDTDRLREIVAKHSDYVQWPVIVGDERANQDAALWTRSPSEVEDNEYIALYKHISGDWQDPLTWVHVRAEGGVEYSAIIFIPKKRPWELDRLDYKVGLKLFQKRIKVLENAGDLVPRYLRFVTGVVDSAEIDLNMSREILQQTPVVRSIRKQLTKRVLRKLVELSRTDADAYTTFWEEYGHIIKEGVHEDGEGAKDQLTELLRYPTTTSDGGLRSLSDVKKDLKDGQEHLWYFTSVDKERIGKAAALEGFKKRGWEVILMSDPVDEWVVMSLRDVEGTALKNAATGELPPLPDEDEDPIAKAAKEQATPLVSWMGGLLSKDVAEVRLSSRLTDSPSVLVDREGGMGANMERILRAANQQVSATKRVLEVNPEHPMVKTLARLNADGQTGLEPFARLLLDHAAIAEGRLDDPEGFAGRLQALMETAARGLAAGAAPVTPTEVLNTDGSPA